VKKPNVTCHKKQSAEILTTAEWQMTVWKINNGESSKDGSQKKNGAIKKQKSEK
jgi:hypothetical protein